MDGTSCHLTWLDQLKVNQSYGALIGNKRLASPHAIKRFLGSFSFCRVYLFRKLLQELFIWRLKPSSRDEILDKHEAEKGHGVEPTYKLLKGFQPLQLNWGW